MKNKSRFPRKRVTRRPSATGLTVRSPVHTAASPLIERKAVLADRTAVRLRAEIADRREQAPDRREEAAPTTFVSGPRTVTQLREANERLLIATVRAEMMTEAAEQATAHASYMAEHDFLTGLPNRSLLMDRLAQSIALARRHGKRVALLYLDIDHFKDVNDTLGHGVGDQLLQSAAKRLKDCVRSSDTVGRHGGDEFVLLLADVDQPHDVALTAGKLIGAMTAPHVIGGHAIHATLSIGFSIYPDDGQDIDTVLRNADTAMYHAKKSGRNNYQAFTAGMNTHAVARRSVEDALHRALQEHRLVLHYQPKVNLETSAITGIEALVRLRRPDDALVYPTEFVSIAEDCGLIVPIGKWVLREACRQAATWLQAGLDIGQMGVNVSAVEFRSKDFLTGVRAILADTGVDPHRLELELTESLLMQDTAMTMANLHALKDLGVRIAIDDFGTGYSSLSYLRRFPVDTIKIDQSFVQDIDGEAGEAIVSAVIALGMSLRRSVVAEGIETLEQLAFLQSRRCAEGQGLLFSQPVPEGEFAALLASGPPLRTNGGHEKTS